MFPRLYGGRTHPLLVNYGSFRMLRPPVPPYSREVKLVFENGLPHFLLLPNKGVPVEPPKKCQSQLIFCHLHLTWYAPIRPDLDPGILNGELSRVRDETRSAPGRDPAEG